jgi:acetyl-CoA carboxylase biotin carboxyl carrier protein
MDFKLIQRLAHLMQQAELTELELDDPKSGARLRLERGAKAAPMAPVVHLTHAGAPAPAAAAPPAAAAALEAAPAAPSGPPPGAKPIQSPMVGTFYRASSPDAEPFVSVGKSVKPDTVICIIEAMKVLNEIRAETSGVIVDVLVENGQPVEFGQPLFFIKPA